jgi:hypothetical protein
MVGEVVLVPLEDGRLGGVQVVQRDGDRVQIALLATIWDCAPSADDVRQALPNAQFRVSIERLAEGQTAGIGLPVPAIDEACAQVDAPLSALIRAFITTAL